MVVLLVHADIAGCAVELEVAVDEDTGVRRRDVVTLVTYAVGSDGMAVGSAVDC